MRSVGGVGGLSSAAHDQCRNAHDPFPRSQRFHRCDLEARMYSLAVFGKRRARVAFEATVTWGMRGRKGGRETTKNALGGGPIRATPQRELQEPTRVPSATRRTAACGSPRPPSPCPGATEL